ncbi:MAG TPA: thiamine phosphate synthase [Candidatus Acidoferrum sp.]|nr:thiamine phosphate synthase [Candidatus Acidoferrum sp.]
MTDREKSILCYVTDRRSLPAPAVATKLAEKIASIAAAGVDWVQIREKDLSGRELAELTREVTAQKRAARIIVNDRVDVAVTEGAGGVHLGETGLPVADVTKWVKRTASGVVVSDDGVASQFPAAARQDFLIGASCHSLESAKAAVRDGADYIFFGPVFATPSKVKFGEPQGVKKLAEVCNAVALPVIAIGGITIENARECVAAGAAGIAAIRLFQDAAEPAQVISELKRLRR